MTTDQFIVTISALVTGLGVTAWLLRAAYTGTEVDTRHRCETRTSHGNCGRPSHGPATNGPHGTVVYRCDRCEREGRW